MSVRKLIRASLVLFVLASAITALTPQSARAQDNKLTIWTKFNADNPQVASDRWLKKVITDYQTDKGVTLENTFVAYNEINTKLNVAVTAGGVVPDVSYVDSASVGFYSNNGTLVDLTDFVKNASWYGDLDPVALASCTAPDGKILCVPTTTTNYFTYYWKDIYPDGFPATTDDLLKIAPSIKEKGKYAYTFKGAENVSVERFYGALILSYGGTLVDADGKAAWANDGAVKAVEWAREVIQKEYAPKVALAPAFDNEEPFKQGEAGGFLAGTFSYVYLTPLVAPTGERFEEAPPAEGFDKNAIAVGAAHDAGKLDFAPMLSAPGGKPVSFIFASAYGIPEGSAHVEEAKAFIDWQMQTAKNVEFAIAYGALPTLKSASADEAFSAPYWQAVLKYQQSSGVAAPAWVNYDQAIGLLSTAIVNCVTDPTKDILAELQAAQDEYNNALN
ncbi:MAG: extracellular solute-binding protein [Anaerolineae bacterium]|nr:extracellular solute-binding protein [Anaerolineae bacterium]